jgi:hypothetical protein
MYSITIENVYEGSLPKLGIQDITLAGNTNGNPGIPPPLPQGRSTVFPPRKIKL